MFKDKERLQTCDLDLDLDLLLNLMYGMNGSGKVVVVQKKNSPLLKKVGNKVSTVNQPTAEVVLPPPKNIFEKSLRNEKVFLEDEKPVKEVSFVHKLPAKEVKTVARKTSSSSHVKISREELLEKQLLEKEDKINMLMNKLTKLEENFSSFVELAQKKNEENERLMREKQSLEEKLALAENLKKIAEKVLKFNLKMNC